MTGLSPANSPGNSTQASPAITVLICAYNRSPVAVECLRRLQQQTFANFDVVLVDDGSTDDTLRQVQLFASTSTLNLRILTQPNAGLGNARNFGLQHVTAPLTLLLGQDVWAHPDFLAQHLASHAANPEPRLAVLGLSRYFDPARTITPYERYLETSGAQFSYGHLRHGDRVDWHYFYTGNLSVKTDLLRQFPSNESLFFLEDAEWGHRITRNGGLTVLYNSHAIADHFHPANVAWSLERAYHVGKAARRLVQAVPELQPEFQVHASPLRLSFYRWLAARHSLWHHSARAMEPLSHHWAMPWLSGKVLRLYFYAGYEGMPKP